MKSPIGIFLAGIMMIVQYNVQHYMLGKYFNIDREYSPKWEIFWLVSWVLVYMLSFAIYDVIFHFFPLW